MQKYKKAVTAGLFVALAFFSFTGSCEANATKQDMWEKMSDDIDHWVDGIGYPIDEEIKEIVIALNISGIETIASCEGHFDHGCLYPWVDLLVFSPETDKLITELKNKFNQIEVEEESLETRYPNLSYYDKQKLPEAQHLLTLYNERFFLYKLYEQAQMNCLEPLNKLLNEFYENRNASYDRILIIPVYGHRLQSIGGDRQLARSEEQQNIKLIEYREEMNDFAAFLKRKFMESN